MLLCFLKFPVKNNGVNLEILQPISFYSSVFMHISPEAAQLEMNTAAKKGQVPGLFLISSILLKMWI